MIASVRDTQLVHGELFDNQPAALRPQGTSESYDFPSRSTPRSRVHSGECFAYRAQRRPEDDAHRDLRSFSRHFRRVEDSGRRWQSDARDLR